MTRVERIRRALDMGVSTGCITGHYSQSRMPGRRWVVWGRAVGAYEYGGSSPMDVERSYSTRDVEYMLRAAGLLGA